MATAAANISPVSELIQLIGLMKEPQAIIKIVNLTKKPAYFKYYSSFATVTPKLLPNESFVFTKTGSKIGLSSTAAISLEIGKSIHNFYVNPKERAANGSFPLVRYNLLKASDTVNFNNYINIIRTKKFTSVDIATAKPILNLGIQKVANFTTESEAEKYNIGVAATANLLNNTSIFYMEVRFEEFTDLKTAPIFSEKDVVTATEKDFSSSDLFESKA